MGYLDFSWNVGSLVFGLIVLITALGLIAYKGEKARLSLWKIVKWFPLLAILILVLSLLKIQWNEEAEIFHKPYVLIAVDVSSSFQSGQRLGLDSAYNEILTELKKEYSHLDVDSKVSYFAVQATGPEDFSNLKTANNRDSLGSLTSLENLLSQIQNSDPKSRPRAIFLISDGRINQGMSSFELDPNFPPLFPLVFNNIPLNDIQLDSLEIISFAKDNELELELTYSQTGLKISKFKVKAHSANKELPKYDVDIEAVKNNSKALFQRKKRFVLPSNLGDSLSLVVEKSNSNEYAYNDTLFLPNYAKEENLPEILMLTPLSSPDERWLIQVLNSGNDFRVELLSRGDIKSFSAGKRQTLWLSQKNYASLSQAELERLKKVPLVIYGNSGFEKIFKVKKAGKLLAFSSSANLKVSSFAASHFNYLEMPLNKIPQKTGRFYPATNYSLCLGEVNENQKKGCAFGEIEENVYGFHLQDYWKTMFSPNSSILSKEYFASVVNGFASYIEENHNDPQIKIRGNLHAGNLLHLAAIVPGSNKVDKQKLVFNVLGQKESFSQTLENWLGNVSEWDVKLNEGTYTLNLRDSNGTTLAEKYIEVKSAQNLELNKIGFDYYRLENLARLSAGKIIYGESLLTNTKSPLPQINAGEIRETQKKSTKFYNQFAIAVILILTMAVYWFLRKKLLLD